MLIILPLEAKVNRRVQKVRYIVVSVMYVSPSKMMISLWFRAMGCFTYDNVIYLTLFIIDISSRQSHIVQQNSTAYRFTPTRCIEHRNPTGRPHRSKFL